MAFSKALAGALFERPGKKVYDCSAVVSMGWTSSTGIIQHIHQNLLLYSLSKNARLPSDRNSERQADATHENI
eukprot:9630767-Karenia_brevis.AAC.1